MSENLDWTQSLGNAVLDRLADVQNAISQIRWSSYTSKILVSNAQQDVYAAAITSASRRRRTIRWRFRNMIRWR